MRMISLEGWIGGEVEMLVGRGGVLIEHVGSPSVLTFEVVI